MDPKYKSFVQTIVFMFFTLTVAVTSSLVHPIGQILVIISAWAIYFLALLLVILTGLKTQSRVAVSSYNKGDFWAAIAIMVMVLSISVVTTAMIPFFYELLVGVTSTAALLFMKVGYIVTTLAS